MDNRLHKINQLLREYSKGQFEKRLKVSVRMDEIDACIASINMLGEELKEVTISRNYFHNIFNSVSDMVFVLDRKGIIRDINQSVTFQLKYDKQTLKGKFIDELSPGETDSFFGNTLKQLRLSNIVVTKITYLKSAAGSKIPVTIAVAWLINESNKKEGILLTAKDITAQLQTEKLVIRAIIDTQEKERQRLARDLHDSLGQQLSAIKFYISASAEAVENTNQQLILKKSNEGLISVLAEMRQICFNLIPKTLEEFGLLKAVKELCNQTASSKQMSFKITQDKTFPALPIEMTIDIFRIIQEFINNAQHHGKANKIKVAFSHSNDAISIHLKDNGSGFDADKKGFNGIGLQNVRSRVKSHNGEIKIKSEFGKGTEYIFSIPLIEQL